MLKNYFIVFLAALVLNVGSNVSVFANTDDLKVAKHAAKVKASIAKLGTGKDARIEVKLRDKTKLKGYVSQINENSFVVVNEMAGTPTEVPYAQTKQVKGNNLSTGVKIAIGVGIILAIAAIAVLCCS